MRYVPALDGLRAISILVVVLLHTHVPGFRGGGIGVDIFFVLSGYLISSILLTERRKAGHISLPNFYWRRVLRLYPALIFFLLGYFVLAPLAWPKYPHDRDVLLAGLYLSDYSYSFWHIPRYLQHTWSLSAEEHFYLIWPILLIALLRYAGRNQLPKLLAICIGIAWLWRSLCADAFGSEVAYRFDTRAVGMMTGCWLASVMELRQPLLVDRAKFFGWAGLLLLVALLPLHPRYIPAWLPIRELSAIGLIVGADSLPLTNRWMVYFGRLSYGIYLWHFPIAKWLNPLGEWWKVAPSVLLLATIASWTSFHTIEAFARRFRARRLQLSTA